MTPAQFATSRGAHRARTPVEETPASILGGYLMIDPLGRVFSDAPGRHVYGPPVLEVGLARSAVGTGWEPQRFLDRGGVWPWRPGQDGDKAPSGA